MWVAAICATPANSCLFVACLLAQAGWPGRAKGLTEGPEGPEEPPASGTVAKAGQSVHPAWQCADLRQVSSCPPRETIETGEHKILKYLRQTVVCQASPDDLNRNDYR